jgi:hypothetical protein
VAVPNRHRCLKDMWHNTCLPLAGKLLPPAVKGQKRHSRLLLAEKALPLGLKGPAAPLTPPPCGEDAAASHKGRAAPAPLMPPPCGEGAAASHKGRAASSAPPPWGKTLPLGLKGPAASGTPPPCGEDAAARPQRPSGMQQVTQHSKRHPHDQRYLLLPVLRRTLPPAADTATCTPLSQGSSRCQPRRPTGILHAASRRGSAASWPRRPCGTAHVSLSQGSRCR